MYSVLTAERLIRFATPWTLSVKRAVQLNQSRVTPRRRHSFSGASRSTRVLLQVPADGAACSGCCCCCVACAGDVICRSEPIIAFGSAASFALRTSGLTNGDSALCLLCMWRAVTTDIMWGICSVTGMCKPAAQDIDYMYSCSLMVTVANLE